MTQNRLPRVFRWDRPSPPPAHPYRDTVLIYLVLACLIVILAWVTGGQVLRAVGIAFVVFVIATTWSSMRWRERLRRDARSRTPGGKQP